MRQDVANIFALVRGAAAQVGLAGGELRLVTGARRLRGAAQLDQRELDVIHAQRPFGVQVEALQRAGRTRCAIDLPAQRKPFATTRNRDVKRCLDLSEIFVEHAAQVGEALIVDRREPEFDWIGFQKGR